MTPEQPKRSGRVAFDARGNPTWEWRTESGSFRRDIDTGRLKALFYNDQLSLANMSGKQPGFDPYNSADKPPREQDPDTKPRKSIDDLRKLSEEIKRARNLKEHKKPKE